MEREVPKRPIFTPTLSTIMVQWVLCWERQKRFSSCKCQGTWQRNATLIFLNRKLFFHQTLSLLLGKKGRRPNIVKNPKLPYLKKISTSTFWCMHCMVTSLGPRPSVGPKALKIYPLEMWPWSFPMSKGLLSWSKFMVTITWSNSLKNIYLKPLGPWLGVNQTWTKGSDHALKSGCSNFCNICPQKPILETFFMFDLIPLLLPFLPCNYEKYFQIKIKINKYQSIKNYQKRHFSTMVPWHLQRENFFWPSHYKIRWIMIVDNISMQTCLLKSPSSMVTLSFIFYLDVNRSHPGTSFNDLSHILEEHKTSSWSMM